MAYGWHTDQVPSMTMRSRQPYRIQSWFDARPGQCFAVPVMLVVMDPVFTGHGSVVNDRLDRVSVVASSSRQGPHRTSWVQQKPGTANTIPIEIPKPRNSQFSSTLLSIMLCTTDKMLFVKNNIKYPDLYFSIYLLVVCFLNLIP